MKQRLDGLDFIRAAACLGILFFHMHISYTGFFAVAVFFALSGFLMTYNALDRPEESAPCLKTSVSLALKRTKKLYGLYLITLIFPLLEQIYGVASGLGKLDGQLVLRIVSNVLLLQSLVPDINTAFFMNGVAWYMSTSLFLYMAFPYIIRRIRRRRGRREAWRVIIITFFAQAAGIYLFTSLAKRFVPADYYSGADVAQWLAYVSPFSRIADFIIACNFAYLFKNRSQTTRSAAAATAAECGALILAFVTERLFDLNMLPATTIYCTAFIPAASLLIWEFARGEGYISRAMNNAAVRFISALSPYVFLIHPIVIMVLTIIITRLPLSAGVQRLIFLFAVPLFTFSLSVLYRKFERRKRSLTNSALRS